MLVRLASEEEKKARDEITYAEWGTGLSLEQWLERERRLRAHEWCESSMYTWVLEDEGRILSSCETFRMQSSFYHKKGHTYGFASVLTEKQYRGTGYATEMMKKVIDATLDGDNIAQAFILYSEVGASIYEKIGFEQCDSREVIIRCDSEMAGEVSVEYHTREESREMVPEISIGESDFFIRPLKSQIDWHFERHDIYAELLGKGAVEHTGASVGTSHFIWTIDFKNNCLRGLISDFANADEAKTLICAALKDCSKFGIHEARFYHSDIFTEWNELKLPHEIVRRDDSIAMLRPNVRDLHAKDWKVITRALWI